MERARGLSGIGALATGLAIIVMACGTATGTPPRKDGGGDRTDVPVTTGGTTATGGVRGSGGATGAGGASATGGVGIGGTTAPGHGGAAGAEGSRTGGRTGAGGSLGTGGKVSGGTGGTAVGGAGGATTKDASVDRAPDVPSMDGSTAVYSGCGYIGGIERAVIAKYDAQAGVCVSLLMESPHRLDGGLGITVNGTWGVAELFLWPAAPDHCATRVAPAGASAALSASGHVTVSRSPATIAIDAVAAFPAKDGGPPLSVEMKAEGVAWMGSCSVP